MFGVYSFSKEPSGLRAHSRAPLQHFWCPQALCPILITVGISKWYLYYTVERKSFVNYVSWTVGRQTVLGHKWLWHPARLPQGYIQLWISEKYPSHWCSCFLWREDILLHKQPMLEVRWKSFSIKVEICVSLPWVQTISVDIWRCFNLHGLWQT